MSASVIVAYEGSDDCFALKVWCKVGDFLFVIDFFFPFQTVKFYSVVEMAYSKGCKETHEFYKWCVGVGKVHSLVVVAFFAGEVW